MNLFKVSVVGFSVIVLVALVLVTVTAHSSEENTSEADSEESFDEMKEMHGTNFEEFHESVFGENWREEMQEMHENCPMMSGDHKDMDSMHEQMHGMMH